MEFMQNTMKTKQKNGKGTENKQEMKTMQKTVDFQTVDTSNHKITRTQSFFNRKQNNHEIIRTLGRRQPVFLKQTKTVGKKLFSDGIHAKRNENNATT